MKTRKDEEMVQFRRGPHGEMGRATGDYAGKQDLSHSRKGLDAI